MRRALALAERGWGRVAPNPMVGAVAVRDGEAVGEGFHAVYGGPHAEVEALARAGDRARGATLYVTLEPCAHHGKTPPCTETIIRAGIGRVVYAVEDPTEAAGGGAERLRAAGIEVESGLCGEEARDLNAPFFTAAMEKRSFVALKLALSLDGRIAEIPGRRTQITGPRAIREAHRLRAGHDAVAIGVGTLLADDPILTVREWEGPRRPPLRVVLDAQLRTPLSSRCVASIDEAPLCIFAGPQADAERVRALERAGARVRIVEESAPGRLQLSAVLDALWKEGVQSVLFEGGARIASELVHLGLVDRLYLFLAPVLLGTQGLAGFEVTARSRWRVVIRRAVGSDTLLALARR